MRKTKLSVAVENIFSSFDGPVSVPDLLVSLKAQGFDPNKTTLYRMLDRFCEEGIARKLIIMDGVAHYEKKSDSHGHFLCTECDEIRCLKNVKAQPFLDHIGVGDQFLTVTSAELSLKGVCAECS